MYIPKNIVVFEVYGRYYADYKLPNGSQFALHRASCGTAKDAYELAVEQIEYLNERRCK